MRVLLKIDLVAPTIGMIVLLLGAGSAEAQPSQREPRSVSSMVTQLATAARAGDPALHAARAAVAAAEARHGAAGSTPPLVASAGIADGPGGDVAAGNVEFQVGRALFIGARVTAARAVSSAAVSAALADFGARERLIDVQVLERFVHAAGWARISQRLRRSDEWLSVADEALRSRFAAGTVRYVDVLRIRTERLQLGAELSRARAGSASALAALAGLVGPALALDTLRTMVDAAASDSASGQWRVVLADAPAVDSLSRLFADVRSASADVTRARAALLEVAAEQRPQVTGAIGLQRIGPVNGGPSAGLLLGLSSSLPFSARAAYSRARAAANADLRWATLHSDAVTAASVVAVQSARIRYDAARERLDGFDVAQLVAADAEREAALAEYGAGTLSLLELLDFERALVRVEIERIRALLDAASALSEVFGLTPLDTGDIA